MGDSNLFIRIPYRIFDRSWKEIAKRGLFPEVFINAAILDETGRDGIIEGLSPLIHEGIPYTIHGPFRDLAPGSKDTLIREATSERLKRTLRVFSSIENPPVNIIFHSSFVPLLHESIKGSWLKESVDTWKMVLSCFPSLGSRILLENVYDPSPRPLKELVERVEDERFGICLDIGHLHVYGNTPIEEWFESFGTLIGEIHIHDNSGSADEHLPPGMGSIDFKKVLSLIQSFDLCPILVLEPVDEKVVDTFLVGARRLGMLQED